MTSTHLFEIQGLLFSKNCVAPLSFLFGFQQPLLSSLNEGRRIKKYYSNNEEACLRGKGETYLKREGERGGGEVI